MLKTIFTILILSINVSIIHAQSAEYELNFSTNSKIVQVNLPCIIKVIYPNAVNGKDFLIRDNVDGRGQFIAEWRYKDPQPDKATIESKLADGYALQRAIEKAIEEKPTKLDTQWVIADDETKTDREIINALVEIERIRRGEE